MSLEMFEFWILYLNVPREGPCKHWNYLNVPKFNELILNFCNLKIHFETFIYFFTILTIMRLQDLKILQPGEDILWQDLDLVPGTQSIEAGYVSLHQDIKRFLHLGYKSGKPEIFGAFSRQLVPLHEKSFKGGCWGWCRAIGKRKQNSTCLAGGRPRGAGWRRASPAAARSGWSRGRAVGEGGTRRGRAGPWFCCFSGGWKRYEVILRRTKECFFKSSLAQTNKTAQNHQNDY